MELLSDDEALLVLRYLPVRSLLDCRLVCKRLLALVAHPDAWRHRRVGDDWLDEFTCLCPVLRVAPCLRGLSENSINTRKPDSCLPASFAWTRCAVTSLKLVVNSQADVGVAAAAINRQDALGRLKELNLSFLVSGGECDAALLLATVLSLRGLEKLNIRGTPSLRSNTTPTPSVERILSTCTRTAPEPSLREFTCELVVELESFVSAILTRHAATLERVDLSWLLHNIASSLSISSTAPLLAALPRLRKLACCSILGVEAVAACESLTDLHLVVSTARRHRRGYRGATKLLQDLKCLRELGLHYAPGPPATGAALAAGVDLIRALSTQPHLEYLNITLRDTDGAMYSSHVQALIRALPALPALHTLRVILGREPEQLLLSISPATAPALKKLLLLLERDVCSHLWLHGDLFKNVMMSNPFLHVKLDLCKPYCFDDACPACSKGCHSSLWRTYGSFLYCHAPGAKCSLDHKLEKEDRFMYWRHISE